MRFCFWIISIIAIAFSQSFSAEAAKPKYWYIKTSATTAIGYKTEAACQKALDQMYRILETAASQPDSDIKLPPRSSRRCLERLPRGWKRTR